MYEINFNRKQFYNILEAIKYTNINCKHPVSNRYHYDRLFTLKKLYDKIAKILSTNFKEKKIKLCDDEIKAIAFTYTYIPDDLKNEIFYKNKNLIELLISVKN